MKRRVFPAELEVKLDENNIVQFAALRLGGEMAAPFKWVQYSVALDDLAHLQPIDTEEGGATNGND